MNSRRFAPLAVVLGLITYVTAQQAPTIVPTAQYSEHNDPIYSVAISPDGQLFATGSFDTTIKFWDTATGKSIRTLSGNNAHKGLVLNVAFSPRGDLLASGGADNAAKLWDVPTRTPFQQIPTGAGVTRVAASADSKFLAIATVQGKIQIWNVADKKVTAECTGHTGAITGLAFLPNGQALTSTGVDKTLRYWNPTNGEAIGKLGVGTATPATLFAHPNSSQLFTTHDDGTLRIWPGTFPQPLAKAQLPSKTSRVAITPDMNFAWIAGEDKVIRQVNLGNGQVAKAFPAAPEAITAIALLGNGNLIAGGLASGQVMLWNANGQVQDSRFGPQGAVRDIAQANNPQQYLTVGGDGMLRVWNLPRPAMAPLKHPAAVTGFTIHPDGKRIFTASQDNVIRLWNNNGIEREFRVHESPIRSLLVDGNQLYSADEQGVVKSWDANSGKVLASVTLQEKLVQDLTVSGDHKHLVARTGKDTITIWALPLTAESKPLKTLTQPAVALASVSDQPQVLGMDDKGRLLTINPAEGTATAHADAPGAVDTVAMHGKGRSATALTARDRSLILIREADGSRVRETNLPAPVKTLAWSPDGQRIAVALKDAAKSVLVYDADQGQILERLAPPARPVEGLAFLADSRTLILRDAGNDVLQHDLSAQAVVRVNQDGLDRAAPLPNGRILTTGKDRMVRVWNETTFQELANLGPTPQPITSLAISSDRASVAIGGENFGMLWQPEPRTSQNLTVEGKVSALAISPKGDQLMIAAGDHSVRFVDLTNQKVREQHWADGPIHAVAMHPSQPRFAIVTEQSLNVPALAIIREIPTSGPAMSPVTVIPNSGQILATGTDGQLQGWNSGNGNAERTIPGVGNVSALAVSKNAQFLAIAGGNGSEILFVTLNDNKIVGRFPVPAQASGLAMHPNGLWVAGILADRTLQIWDTSLTSGQPGPNFGKPLQSFALTAIPTSLTLFGPDQALELVTGNEAGQVEFWKLASDQPVKNLPHPNMVDAVAFDGTGDLLATACHDGKLRIWDVAKGQATKTIDAHIQPQVSAIYTVLWSPDNKLVLTGSFDQSIKFWDVASGNLVREIKPGSDKPDAPGHRDQVFTLAIDKSGKYLASGSSDRTIKLWDFEKGTLVRDLPNPDQPQPPAGFQHASHPGFVYAVRFLPDGQTLLSAGPAPRGQAYLALWSWQDGKLRASGTLPVGPIYSVAVLPDGKECLLGCGPKNRTVTQSDVVRVRLPGP